MKKKQLHGNYSGVFVRTLRSPNNCTASTAVRQHIQQCTVYNILHISLVKHLASKQDKKCCVKTHIEHFINIVVPHSARALKAVVPHTGKGLAVGFDTCVHHSAVFDVNLTFWSANCPLTSQTQQHDGWLQSTTEWERWKTTSSGWTQKGKGSFRIGMSLADGCRTVEFWVRVALAQVVIVFLFISKNHSCFMLYLRFSGIRSARE